jgi:hypothetical protein
MDIEEFQDTFEPTHHEPTRESSHDGSASMNILSDSALLSHDNRSGG